MVSNGVQGTSLKVLARLESVTQCTAFMADCAAAAGFPRACAQDIELVVEEVLVNICLYAYPEEPGEVELRCVEADSLHLMLEFIDTGRPFNILTLLGPNLESDMDQRPVGGLGVPLIRALVDSITYRREDDRNILRLVAKSRR
jgi:anti-sigma regulatory factor (Ser/Thr protein kinase)